MSLNMPPIRTCPRSISGHFSGSSRQNLQQFANAQARLQEQNHLRGADSHPFAQPNNLGNRALQRLFLRGGERLGNCNAPGCGQRRFCCHSDMIGQPNQSRL
jgi:hypothetical protein